MPLTTDTVLQNRYRIVQQLGQGGMGTVYEAKALRLNTTVALKETHFTDEKLRKQFEREAQLLAGLRHPALPRVIDHFDEGDGLYLVMDFIEGEDLWGMLQQRASAFPVNEVTAWAEQLLDALQYLHSQNPPVIHRDIKLQNLKLSDRGQIILLDFGLAKGLADATVNIVTTRTVLGFSLPYAPLEQILQVDDSWRDHLSVTHPDEVERLRKSGTDHRSDLYSIGATLLHLLTNKMPTNAPTRAISIWSGHPDPLENALRQGIPDKLGTVLKQSMALEPDQRFSSALEMRKALENTFQTNQLETITLPPTIISPISDEAQEHKLETATTIEAIKNIGAIELTETQRLQLEYWTAFRNCLQQHSSFLRLPKPQPQNWFLISIGNANFGLVATVHKKGRRICAYLVFYGPDAKPHFHLLQRDKEAIEGEVKEPLEWRELPKGKESQIRLCKYKTDVENRQDWEAQHEWLKEKLELFHKVFAPRIKNLNASDYVPVAPSDEKQIPYSTIASPTITSPTFTPEHPPSIEIPTVRKPKRNLWIISGTLILGIVIVAAILFFQRGFNKDKAATNFSGEKSTDLRDKYGGSVCLIVGTYIFVDSASGQPLRYTEGTNAYPVPYGNGQIIEFGFNGTGFYVGNGYVLTTRYTTQPWLGDEGVGNFVSSVGGQPRVKTLIAYFPNKQPIVLEVKQAAQNEDFVTCVFDGAELQANIPAIPLDSTSEYSTRLKAEASL